MTIHLLKTGLLNEGRLHFLATLQNFLAKRRSGQTRPGEATRIWVGKYIPLSTPNFNLIISVIGFSTANLGLKFSVIY